MKRNQHRGAVVSRLINEIEYEWLVGGLPNEGQEIIAGLDAADRFADELEAVAEDRYLLIDPSCIDEEDLKRKGSFTLPPEVDEEIDQAHKDNREVIFTNNLGQHLADSMMEIALVQHHIDDSLKNLDVRRKLAAVRGRTINFLGRREISYTSMLSYTFCNMWFCFGLDYRLELIPLIREIEGTVPKCPSGVFWGNYREDFLADFFDSFRERLPPVPLDSVQNAAAWIHADLTFQRRSKARQEAKPEQWTLLAWPSEWWPIFDKAGHKFAVEKFKRYVTETLQLRYRRLKKRYSFPIDSLLAHGIMVPSHLMPPTDPKK